MEKKTSIKKPLIIVFICIALLIPLLAFISKSNNKINTNMNNYKNIAYSFELNYPDTAKIEEYNENNRLTLYIYTNINAKLKYSEQFENPLVNLFTLTAEEISEDSEQYKQIFIQSYRQAMDKDIQDRTLGNEVWKNIVYTDQRTEQLMDELYLYKNGTLYHITLNPVLDKKTNWGNFNDLSTAYDLSTENLENIQKQFDQILESFKFN